MWLYSLVCVGPGRKPEHWFSHDAALLIANIRSRDIQLLQQETKADVMIGSEQFSFLRHYVLFNIFVKGRVFCDKYKLLQPYAA